MATRWKFGQGQTSKEERDEIKDALKTGRAEAYVQGQRWRDMIEAETERRQAVKAARRGGMSDVEWVQNRRMI